MEVPLGYLPQETVAAYVDQRRVALEQRQAVTAFVYRRTAGHPRWHDGVSSSTTWGWQSGRMGQ